jgi:hypothetical protein
MSSSDPIEVRRPSDRRYVILGGPGGYLTVQRAGSPMIADRYRRWQVLGTYNAPRNRWHAPMACANQAKDWALRTFEVV